MKNTEKMVEIKKLIRVYEMRKEQLKTDYERAVKNVDEEITSLKIELANLVLEEQSETEAEADDGLTTIVGIKFFNGNKTYDYIWDSSEAVNVGDMVYVEGKWGGTQRVEVVAVRKEDLSNADHEYKCAYPLG